MRQSSLTSLEDHGRKARPLHNAVLEAIKQNSLDGFLARVRPLDLLKDGRNCIFLYPSFLPEQSWIARGNLLHIAARESATHIIAFLIGYGFNLNWPDPAWGNTPLHNIIDSRSERSLEAAELVIRAGADPNIKNDLGNTPLHSAVYANNLPITRLLVESGANLIAINRIKFTPLELSYAVSERLLIAEFLIESGAPKHLASDDSPQP